MKYHCPNCDQKYRLGDDMFGTSVACRQCGEMMNLPKAQLAQTTQTPAPAATPSASSVQSKLSIKSKAPLVLILLLILAASAGLYYYQQQNTATLVVTSPGSGTATGATPTITKIKWVFQEPKVNDLPKFIVPLIDLPTFINKKNDSSDYWNRRRLCKNINLNPAWSSTGATFYYMDRTSGKAVAKKIDAAHPLPAPVPAFTSEERRQLKLPDGNISQFNVHQQKLHCRIGNQWYQIPQTEAKKVAQPSWKKSNPLKQQRSGRNNRRSPNNKFDVRMVNGKVTLKDLSARTEKVVGTSTTDYAEFNSRSCYWSPDSTKFTVARLKPGQRRKISFVEKNPAQGPAPKIHTIRYDKPGDRIDISRPVTYFVDNSKVIESTEQFAKNPFGMGQIRWSKDSQSYTYEYVERGFGQMLLIEVNMTTGKERVVIDETSETFVHRSKAFCYHLANDKEILWGSERDGFQHLYLYDRTSGKVKQQVTSGDWLYRDVLDIDEASRTVLFTASGVYPDQNPYYQHLCSVKLDGSGFKILTTGDGNHQISLSPNKQFFYCKWSRVDHAPVHELRRIDGTLVREIARGDSSSFEKEYRLPERFSTTDRDNKYQIHGIIRYPTHFDPTKKHPVIETIYAGPHGSHVPIDFSESRRQALLDQGFFLIQIDGRGTANRCKEFSHFSYKNLKDAGFPDRIKFIKDAAKKIPQIDFERVGIMGGSAGGQNSTGAVIFHGDFYKAAASDCGCHDNRLDKIWWNEQWMDYPIGSHYSTNSNIDNAQKLTGKLLLTVGEVDTNVDPASTYKLSEALHAAGKDHELIIIPSKGHGAGGGDLGARYRRYQFFRQHIGQ